LDDEIDRKIDVTAMQCLLVQKRHKTDDLTLIGSGANGLGMSAYRSVNGPMNRKQSNFAAKTDPFHVIMDLITF